MGESSYALLYGIVFLFMGIILTFFQNKILRIQGKSEQGDWSIKQRKLKFKIGGIGSLIVGILFILMAIIK